MIHKVVDTVINQLFAIFIPAINRNRAKELTALTVKSAYASIIGGFILEKQCDKKL